MNIFETRKVNHTPRNYSTVTKDINSLPQAFKGTYLQEKTRWGYTARISSLLDMIRDTYGIKEWELLELEQVNNGELQARWIDWLLEYKEGKDIDFGNIWEDLKKTLTFSLKEINLIETGEVDLRLWAIYTYLINQNLPITY